MSAPIDEVRKRLREWSNDRNARFDPRLDLDALLADHERLRNSIEVANRLCAVAHAERDEARAEVERLRAVVTASRSEKRRCADASCGHCVGCCEAMREEFNVAASQRDALRAEVAKLRNEADAANRIVRDDFNEMKDLRTALAKAEAEVRLAKQKVDCTYGDTPGLIHCPITAPCMTHRLEQSEARFAQAVALDEEYRVRSTKERAALIVLNDELQAQAAAMRKALSQLLGSGHNLKAFAKMLLDWGKPGVDVSNEAMHIVKSAEEWHGHICTALSSDAGRAMLDELAELRKRLSPEARKRVAELVRGAAGTITEHQVGQPWARGRLNEALKLLEGE